MASRSRVEADSAGAGWRGLTLQMFVLIVLPITALVLVIALGGLSLHREAMRTLVGERDRRAARAAASTLTEQLNHRASAIQGLALRASPDYTDVSPKAIIESADYLVSDFDRGFGLFLPDGTMLAATGAVTRWDGVDAPHQTVIRNALTRDGSPSYTLLDDPLSGDAAMLVASPASGEGPVALGLFTPALLVRTALASAVPSGEQTVALVVSPYGEVLYRTGSELPLEALTTHPGVAEALRGESGTSYLNVGGREHVVAFSPVSPVGWALVIEEPWDAVANPLLRTTEAAPLVMVPVLIVAVSALWFAARRIIQPLRDLENRAASLAWGDYQAIEEPVGGIEEISRLQRTLIYLADRVQSAQMGLRSYIGAITAGQEDERRRLARELHDDTLQSLIALNQRLQLARLNLNGSPGAESLDEICAMTEQTIQDLRRITRALRPLYLEDLGLVAALEMLARETEQASSIRVQFQLHGIEMRLSPTEELTLYRMAQEGLSNVVRHARGSRASLTLHFTPEELILEVTDDGQGFDVPESPAEFAPRGHFGLLGLYERAELIGAQLKLVSQPDQGTRLTVSLPLTPERT
jgi:signal transduction histidine kinase